MNNILNLFFPIVEGFCKKKKKNTCAREFVELRLLGVTVEKFLWDESFFF